MKPLSHIRILDLSRVLAGPFATQLLADLGAEVLKIEPPSGDPSRGWGPPFNDGIETESAYFCCANRGKQSRILNLTLPEHRKHLHDLLRGTDVLVEDLSPEGAESLGLTWDQLHTLHPRLIVASVRGFASDLPVSGRPAYDFIAQAESGWMSITGEKDGSPVRMGAPLADILCALYTANGIQAALLHRERAGGQGIHVEVPLMEAALAGLAHVASASLMTGETPERHGNSHPHLVPYQVFACSDGNIVIGVGTDRQFEVLALWFGLQLDEHPNWRNNPGRIQDRETILAELSRHFAGHQTEDVLHFCESHAIPASPIRSVNDVLFGQAGRLHHLIRPLFDTETQRMMPVLATPILLNGERACSPIPPPRWKP